MEQNILPIIGEAISKMNESNYTIANISPRPGMFAGAFAAMMAIWLIVIVIMVLLFILWIFMIIDVSKRQFKLEHDKIGWILIIVLTGYIGAIVYYFAIKRGDKH